MGNEIANQLMDKPTFIPQTHKARIKPIGEIEAQMHHACTMHKPTKIHNKYYYEEKLGPTQSKFMYYVISGYLTTKSTTNSPTTHGRPLES